MPYSNPMKEAMNAEHPLSPADPARRYRLGLGHRIASRRVAGQRRRGAGAQDDPRRHYVPYGVWKVPFAYHTRLKILLNVPDLFVFWNVEKN